MHRKLFQTASWALALISLGALLSCQSPLNTTTATVTLSFSSAGRAVVADLDGLVTSYAVTLTSNEGYSSLNTTVASGSTATFAVVNAGSWDASVTVYHNATAIGVGSLASQSVSAGTTAVWTVPVSTTQTATGNFSFTFAVPKSLGVTGVTGQLYTPANVVTGNALTPTLTTSGSDTVGTIAQAGIASGAYRLQLTFVRGTTTVGSYSEAVNVWDGVTSDQWLDSLGALTSQRTFTVVDFRGTAWQTVGATEVATGANTDGQSLALDQSDTPYVAYTDETTFAVNVKKLSGNAWVSLGTVGYSQGLPSLVIDSTGIPYVAFASPSTPGDPESRPLLSVVKLEDGAWVPVGEAQFAALDSSTPSLAFDPTGTPYVAYSDGLAPGYDDEKISVMKLQSGAWVQVGAAGFSPVNSYAPSLAFDPSGTPFVAYQDTPAGYKLSVMKFANGSWDYVGSSAFTASNGQNGFTPHLVIDASGTPYVTYRDSANDYKASVVKFDGESWGYVGGAGFSAGEADDPTLALDTSGTPYVAFSEWNADWTQVRARVMKFDGNGWVSINDLGVVTTDSSYPSLAIADSGAPYVAHTETGNITVRKFE